MELENTTDNTFDVVIVGAGPAGATAAYYLSKGMEGFGGKNVALLDRAAFPRDKFCGDAWAEPALGILEDMGVLQKLTADGLVQDCVSGGFVSPFGESFISVDEPEAANKPRDVRTFAIKRRICDEAIVRAAQAQGAHLFENADCESASLEKDGLWTIRCRDGRVFRSKMLVAADGAASNLSRSLGIVTTAPDGAASRQYIKGGTHNFKSGGVMFYPEYTIPGYVAIFKHYDDDIDIGVYLIQGGSTLPEDILEVSIDGVANDPFMQRLIGPNAVPLERPRVASLRTGGVEQSTSAQFMAVGDAAGQTDPLTGEGIHTGMIGARLAAQTIHEMYESNDFSARACRVYHERWWDDFGHEFPAASKSARMIYKVPLFMEAATRVAQKKGDAFMQDFGAVMAGLKPKSFFYRPDVLFPILSELVKAWFTHKVRRAYPSMRAAYEARALELSSRDTSFNRSGVIDSEVPAVKLNLQAGAADELDKLFRFQIGEAGARPLHIFYGSEYGFAADVAEQLAERIFALGQQGDKQTLDIRLLNLEHSSILDWQRIDSCLFLCSTAGDGDPPQTIEPFLDFLEKETPDLSNVNFSVLAFGDSAYPNFCAAGLRLEEQLLKANAKCLAPLGKVNAESPVDIDSWFAGVEKVLADKGYWQSRSILVDETFQERAEDYFASLEEPSPGSSARVPVSVRVNERHALSDVEKGGAEIFSVSVNAEFEGGVLEWLPGDALGVYPENPQAEAERVLGAGLFDAGATVELPRKRGRACLREAIEQHLDIKNIQSGLWSLLEERVADAERDALASLGEDRSLLELQDLLELLPLTFGALTEQELVDQLALLQPRYYSIASSASVNEKQIDLAVGGLAFEVRDQPRVGVASHFLNHQLAVGGSLSAFVQANRHFRIPAEESGKACVMIGAGTGVAPYRAFMQELEGRSTDRKHLLFFGCRHQGADFLYAPEWQNWQEKQLVDVYTAFSRDQAEKVYVQHKLKAQGELVWNRIESGDHFYVCGDATQMAGDVEKALLEIIARFGNESEDGAKQLLDAMSRDGRYQKDVWV